MDTLIIPNSFDQKYGLNVLIDFIYAKSYLIVITPVQW